MCFGFDFTCPSWSTNILDQYIKTINTFSKYDNILVYNVGNEGLTNGATNAAPFLKAAARDIKAYLPSPPPRSSGTPTSTAPRPSATPSRPTSCDPTGKNDGSTSIDIFGLNNYEWCGNASAMTFDRINAEFKDYNVVAYLCVFPPTPYFRLSLANPLLPPTPPNVLTPHTSTRLPPFLQLILPGHLLLPSPPCAFPAPNPRFVPPKSLCVPATLSTSCYATRLLPAPSCPFSHLYSYSDLSVFFLMRLHDSLSSLHPTHPTSVTAPLSSVVALVLARVCTIHLSAPSFSPLYPSPQPPRTSPFLPRLLWATSRQLHPHPRARVADGGDAPRPRFAVTPTRSPPRLFFLHNLFLTRPTPSAPSPVGGLHAHLPL
ncbi:Glucanosyltransferase-domain-containing protein [Mycena epipterygia]|nr:Glucanosyltransferase-domain-containing protein [Mycena epipterygia]